MTLKKILTLNLCLLSYSLNANASEEANASESFKSHTRKHAMTKSFSFNDLRELQRELQIDSSESSASSSPSQSHEDVIDLELDNLQLDSSGSSTSQPPDQSHSITPRNPFILSNIQGSLLNKGVPIDNLEGGFVLLFNTAGKLQNPAICQLKHVSAAMELGSPEAFLVKGVIDQVHGIYEFAFRHFSTAASGNDGNGQRDCGGTSTELCFYNFYKLLSQGGFIEENGKLIQTSQHHRYNAEDYKKFTTTGSILESQLQSLIEVVKSQSRSHQESSSSSKLKKRSKSINRENQENEGHKLSKSPSFWGGNFFRKEKATQLQDESMQIKALVSPRPGNKKK